MSTLIVYCHPYDHSFNHAVLMAVQSNLENRRIPYEVIDLHRDGFQPAYDAEELRLFHSGQTHDPLVERYLSMVKQASSIVVIAPIWWNDVPAMLKGFIDKVMKEGEGLSHTVTRMGIHGCLTNLQHGYVLTTSTSPTLYFRLFMGNGIKRVFVNGTLKQLGVGHRTWMYFGGVTTSTAQRRQRYLSRIRAYDFNA